MRLNVMLLAVVLGLLLTSSVGWAEYTVWRPVRPYHDPYPQYCPPGYMPVMPSEPVERTQPRPGETDRPGETSPDSSTTDPGSDLSQPPESSAFTPGGDSMTASAAASATPNLFGDLGGGSATLITIPQPDVLFTTFGGTIVFSGTSAPVPFQAAQSGSGVTLTNNLSTITVFNTQLGSPVVFMSNGPASTIDPVIALSENAEVLAAFQAEAVNRMFPAGNLSFRSGAGAQDSKANAQGDRSQYAVDVFYDYFVPQAPLVVSVPTPAGGGVVGRTKIADDNSPIPRDRVILGFDYFDSVPLTPNGINVRRYAPGIEKTFLNGDASFEVRFPFASTLDSESVLDGMQSRATQFGNLLLNLKVLLYGDECIHVATGLGAALPTAEDIRVRRPDGSDFVTIENDRFILNGDKIRPDGSDFVTIENESIILTPYIAALYTPNKKVFAQGWAQVGFDVADSPVSANINMDGLVPVGALEDQTLLQLDGQIGYWIYQSPCPCSCVQGVAPFIELHYNTTVDDASVINRNNITVGDLRGRTDELNLTLGAHSQLRNNMVLSSGLVLPLRDGDDQFFDYQFGLRLNWYFGGNGRENPSVYASGF